ncbi:MaoC family dehydratase N-terminal domain-containing protein [Dactylosporangium sp. NPDC051484]|uniref:MaoC family dehydratase n=1 Tax=Dactylosporangium sp. NPDC051484 TaxID=3154942 RepID=UPI00344F14F8
MSQSIETETSLLSPAAREWVGRTFELSSGVITAEAVLRYVGATNDRTPAYRSVDAAGAIGLSRIPAPALLYMGATRPIVPVDELTFDGVTDDRRPPVGEGAGMAGEISVEFLHPVCVGDSLRGFRTLTDLTLKHGRSRDFVVATWVTEYRNQDDVVVVREVAQQILY